MSYDFSVNSSAVLSTGLTTHSTTRSWAMWCNVASTPTGGSASSGMLTSQTDGSSGWFLTITGSSFPTVPNMLYFGCYWNSGTLYSWVCSKPTAGVWIHVAASYDRSSSSNSPKLYIGGVLQSLLNGGFPTGSYTSNSLAVNVGNRSFDLNRNVAGKIQEYGEWPRILNDDEVAELAAGYSVARLQPEIDISFRSNVLDLCGGTATLSLATQSDLGPPLIAT